MQNNRLTFMERLSERLTSVEAIHKEIRSDRKSVGTHRIAGKKIYIPPNRCLPSKRLVCISEYPESMLYKLTSGKEIPHYKPRGKMIYFAKEDLDEWLLQNYEPTVDEAARMANEAAATQPSLIKDAMENERRTEYNVDMRPEEDFLSDILSASQIRATDTYETPPQIIWIDNSTIATLGNFSASTGKAKSKKHLTFRPLSLHRWQGNKC